MPFATATARLREQRDDDCPRALLAIGARWHGNGGHSSANVLDGTRTERDASCSETRAASGVWAGGALEQQARRGGRSLRRAMPVNAATSGDADRPPEHCGDAFTAAATLFRPAHSALLPFAMPHRVPAKGPAPMWSAACWTRWPRWAGPTAGRDHAPVHERDRGVRRRGRSLVVGGGADAAGPLRGSPETTCTGRGQPDGGGSRGCSCRRA